MGDSASAESYSAGHAHHGLGGYRRGDIRQFPHLTGMEDSEMLARATESYLGMQASPPQDIDQSDSDALSSDGLLSDSDDDTPENVTRKFRELDPKEHHDESKGISATSRERAHEYCIQPCSFSLWGKSIVSVRIGSRMLVAADRLGGLHSLGGVERNNELSPRSSSLRWSLRKEAMPVEAMKT